jgi:hypothetical protein
MFYSAIKELQRNSAVAVPSKFITQQFGAVVFKF